MRTLVLGVLLALFTGVAFAQTTDLNKPQVHITDASINAGDMVNWTKDNVYMLDGYVYVEDGAELTIEAGTVIKGIQQPSTGDIASVLVIARGGKLFAEGTATMPIVFTTEYDSVALADNDPNDGVDYTIDRGLWGGVVLLGKSTLNIASEAVVEGLPDDEPLHRSWYGGNDDADNSGTLRYISIRYTGITVEANKELQGLTLGCVGSGTTIEYIESFNSSDDGYEFFGSTVNTKYLVSAFNSDDSFDYDQGFRGTGQFWFAIQSPELGNRVGEYDSGDKGALTAEPKSNPQLYNCTYIGSGASSANTDNDLVLTYKEYGGGGHYNSIFTDFRGNAVKVEDLGGADSRERLDAGELKLENNIWYKAAGVALNDMVEQDFMQTYLAANNNSVVDPQLRAVGRGQGELDPRPVSGGAAYTTPRADYPSDGFLTPVSYMGAFGSGNWLAGWTALDQNGIIGEVNTGGDVFVKDGDINAGDKVTWTKDNTYFLDGFVYVEDGAELTIEAGTVIKGLQQPSTGDIASALVIARGAKIFAIGTQQEPIIFTTEYDDVTLPDNDPNDGVDYTLDRGLWGGVVLLGKSTLNIASEAVVEGLPDDEPLRRSWYGGNDDADNSGIMRYVSIRYTGITVEANKELQGLTLGCVGSGTTIEYIESFNSADDGYEFFGGTVNTRFMVSAFNSDDSFDYDQGFRGMGQFWFAIQSPELGNRIGEYDSGDKGALTAEPKSNPQLYNCTYIGSGANSANTDNDLVLTYKEYGGGGHYNSIFTDFRGKAVKVEDLGGADSRERLDAGELKLENNIWFKEAGLTLNDIVDQDFMQTYLAANNNSVVDPQLRAVGRGQGELDPRPVSGGAAYTTPRADYPSDEFYTPVSYMGAFGSGNWLAGWTALDQNGIIGEINSGGDVFVKDGDINAGDKVTWTKDNTYFLDGFVYVEDGAELTIEAGTVIKGLQQPSTGDIASALIITRGAKIFANGTANEPIIFTSEYDDVNLKDDDPNDGVDWTIDRGLWAGVVLLGKSTLNIASEAVVEGLPDDEPLRRSWYGGNDDADNSGVMRYVSIRYTGITVEANKELQGLTLGCVGSGTTIEYIESFNSSDDGYEFFGGTVNTKYMVSAFNSDDSYDYDQGFRGKGQFWFVIQSPELGNRAGEYDSGDKGALTASPKSNPQLYNCTYIGSGASSANTDNDLVLTYKEYAGGGHYNSIFTDFRGNAVKVEDLGGADSRERLDAGELKLENNIWWKADGVALNDMVEQDFVQTYMAANNNYVVNPSLRGISRTTDGQLDPRPNIGAHPYFQQRADYPAGDAFYTPVNYIGAFGDDNWLMGWTALSQNGIAGELTATDVTPVGSAAVDFTLNQNYPNPFNPTTTISFSVPSNNDVKIEVFNALGAKVATVVNGNFNAGTYNVTFNATGLPSGMYMYRLTSGSTMLAKSMLLSK